MGNINDQSLVIRENFGDNSPKTLSIFWLMMGNWDLRFVDELGFLWRMSFIKGKARKKLFVHSEYSLPEMKILTSLVWFFDSTFPIDRFKILYISIKLFFQFWLWFGKVLLLWFESQLGVTLFKCNSMKTRKQTFKSDRKEKSQISICSLCLENLCFVQISR